MEVAACFAREDIADLFRNVGGRTVVEVEIRGDLVTGESLFGTVDLTVLGVGGPSTASVSPNPLNRGGHLRFTSTKSGPMTVRMFDLNGHLVRTLLNATPMQPGPHAIWIDGRDRDGNELASGIYFFRVDAVDGVATGRFVIVK